MVTVAGPKFASFVAIADRGRLRPVVRNADEHVSLLGAAEFAGGILVAQLTAYEISDYAWRLFTPGGTEVGTKAAPQGLHALARSSRGIVYSVGYPRPGVACPFQPYAEPRCSVLLDPAQDFSDFG